MPSDWWFTAGGKVAREPRPRYEAWRHRVETLLGRCGSLEMLTLGILSVAIVVGMFTVELLQGN